MSQCGQRKAVFTAEVMAMYNHEEESYSRQSRKKKGERSIAVDCGRNKPKFLLVQKNKKRTYLKLHVCELNKTIEIEVREILKKVHGERKLDKKFLASILSNMPKTIQLKRVKNVWQIVDCNIFKIDIVA